MKNRQWLLARRPDGAIKDSDFDFVETEAPAPGEGQVLVRNLMLSCDPTQRGWIAFDTYLLAVRIGEVVRSIGAGRIEASNDPDFTVGDIVSARVGWQDDVADEPQGPASTSWLPTRPLELAMSALGLTGMTAYFGLLEVAGRSPAKRSSFRVWQASDRFGRRADRQDQGLPRYRHRGRAGEMPLAR